MKKILLILGFCFVAYYSQAQTPAQGGTSYIPQDSGYYATPVIQTLPKTINDFTSSENDGMSMNAQQMASTAAQNINKLAATGRNIESRAGETPTIKAAPQSGTAYYLDGVRLTNPGLIMPNP